MVPDSKVHGANMGPIWGRQDPAGPNVDPMNLAVWGVLLCVIANPYPNINYGLTLTENIDCIDRIRIWVNKCLPQIFMK